MTKQEEFFKFARERHRIYLRRAEGKAFPWTDDPILQQNKFTNVFRELDRTTIWFRKNVRDVYDGRPEILLATVIFRWFNRIETGEAIFCQNDLFGKSSAFEEFLRTGETAVLARAIMAYCGKGPYFTGAYMIRSPTGMTKLNGILKMIQHFNYKSNWKWFAAEGADGRLSLEMMWSWLKEHPCQGPFHAYEVVTDLRHTFLLREAPDTMTWGNPGPGCKRGVSRILDLGTRKTRKGKTRPKVPTRKQIDDVMLDLLKKSRMKKYWPQNWTKWEMREVEHTLCEWDKYERIRCGQGRMKGRYRPNL